MMEWWSNYIERAKVNGLMGISEVKNVWNSW
jgi:hypothetical protein